MAKHDSDKSEKCRLSVGNSELLSGIFCRGLLSWYIVLVDPNGLIFLFLRPFSRAGRQHCTMSGKQNHKNEWHLRLIAHSFTKLSQSKCLITGLINTRILNYRLFLSVCNASTVYKSLYKGLKYIEYYSKLSCYSRIFENHCLGKPKTLPYT